MSNLGNKKTMARNIRHHMELNGKTRLDLCNDLGFKYTTLTDWLNGNTYPRIDKIEMLANYFGITKADLVEDQVNVIVSDQDPQLEHVIRIAKTLNAQGLVKLGDYAEDLADNLKYLKEKPTQADTEEIRVAARGGVVAKQEHPVDEDAFLRAIAESKPPEKV